MAVVIIGTRHGVYPVQAHWLDTTAQCYRRWELAGRPQAPLRATWMFDLAGRMIFAPAA